jgi:hypothetical protein
LPLTACLCFDLPQTPKIEMDERQMAKINLRDYYPFYNADLFIDTPNEVAAVLSEAERLERNYGCQTGGRRSIFRNILYKRF